ncbi:MAG: uroporphyrinogen decarboxylase [Acidobacteria bacterium]|nr:uroporphyrinogen decarboxylase [Acidobacteriota bacterium]
MPPDFRGLRVLLFQCPQAGASADRIVRLGGVAVEAPDPAIEASRRDEWAQAILSARADLVLFHRPDQVPALVGAGADRLLDAFRGTGIGSFDPETSAALRQAGLTPDHEADPSEPEDWIRELARRGRDLLERKRRSRALGVDTNRWRRIDAAWEAGPGREHRAGRADSPFLRACRREATPYTPVWIMRQAGRYQREYRDLRSRVPFVDLCRNPELAAEVTLMAVDRLGVDAAILFSDILTVLEPMGIPVRFDRADGPGIDRPIRTEADWRGLPEPDAAGLEFVYAAVRLARRALRPDLPLIGFAGAPFTVASYVVEGGRSHRFENAKTMMFHAPDLWDRILGRLARLIAEYLNRQIQAGADAVQLFDSWAGCLAPDDYRRFVLPHTRRLIGSLSGPAPVIHFATGNPALLELLREAGGDVIGLDWRVDLGQARRRLGDGVAVMGNLDPVVLLAPPQEIRRQVGRILEKAEGRPGHVFNLGHGILPQTPPGHVSALVDAVHELSAR